MCVRDAAPSWEPHAARRWIFNVKLLVNRSRSFLGCHVETGTKNVCTCRISDIIKTDHCSTLPEGSCETDGNTERKNECKTKNSKSNSLHYCSFSNFANFHNLTESLTFALNGVASGNGLNGTLSWLQRP